MFKLIQPQVNKSAFAICVALISSPSQETPPHQLPSHPRGVYLTSIEQQKPAIGFEALTKANSLLP